MAIAVQRPLGFPLRIVQGIFQAKRFPWRVSGDPAVSAGHSGVFCRVGRPPGR